MKKIQETRQARGAAKKTLGKKQRIIPCPPFDDFLGNFFQPHHGENMMTPQTGRFPFRTVLTIATVAPPAAGGGGGDWGGGAESRGRGPPVAGVRPGAPGVVLPMPRATTASAWLLAND